MHVLNFFFFFSFFFSPSLPKPESKLDILVPGREVFFFSHTLESKINSRQKFKDGKVQEINKKKD